MISDIANKFQEITKFNLYSYFEDYANFMRNQYPSVRAYFAGNSESIDASYMDMLSSLSSRSDDLLKLFSAFGPKLSNVGYWELQIYCQDLNDTIKKVEKLPKYLRTSKTPRGYKPYVQVNFNVGGLRDFRDIASRINSDEITEESLILGNDFEEEDYEIDTLTNAMAFYQNNRDVVVQTILEEPVDSKVYGRDINRVIKFVYNDLDVVKYEDNITQKVEILCELVRGSVPEMPKFGRKNISGNNFGAYNYPELAREIQGVFLQDDLFDSVEIENIRIENGDVYITLNIRTKYIYTIKKTLVI